MAITPEMLRLVERLRNGIIRQERAVAVQLRREYGKVYRALRQQALDVRKQIKAAEAAGQVISPWRMHRLERLQSLQRQALAESYRFADMAAGLITDAEREALLAGQRDGYELLLSALPDDAGVLVPWDRLPVPAIDAMVGVLADGSPLSRLLQEALGDAAQGFMDQLVAGLAAGWNPRKLARVLRDEYGMGLTRALRISRTEILRAYRTATLLEYRQSRMVLGWERHATQDSRTCMACIMLDGTRYTTEQAMDDHVNGRCAMLPITPSWRDLGFDIDEPDFDRQLAQDWFLEQPDAVQRGMLGPGKYDAWRAGLFGLDDLPKLRRDPVWGDSWVPKSLRELTAVAERMAA